MGFGITRKFLAIRFEIYFEHVEKETFQTVKYINQYAFISSQGFT